MDDPPGEIFQVEDPQGHGVKLTRPDGTSVIINPNFVAYIRKPMPKENGNSIIVFSNGAQQAVMETVEELIANAHITAPGEEGP